ncbi:MAG TPA: hypothetical protein VGL42_04285 [Opitutaceae bacterium]|jgi:peptidyl-prolyl cis-trans isomerase D
MISWIQRTFQQHFRAVFGVLLAVIIISFIITIGASPGIGNGDRRVTEQDFYGQNVASTAVVDRIERDGRESIQLQEPSALYYLTTQQVRAYALSRVAALALANQWHLPEIASDSQEMVAFIRRTPAFFGQDRQFDAQRYAEIRDQYRAAGPSGEEYLAMILAEDYRIQKVEALLGGPGFIPANDIRNDFLDQETTWTVSTATVDYASFKGPSSATDEQLRKYFSAHAAQYTIPTRVSVGYVDFPASKYLASIHPTDAEVREYYDRNPSRFPAPAPKTAPGSKTPPKADPNADFAAVRSQVQLAAAMDQARSKAAQEASDFAYALYQSKATRGPALDQFLASHHVVEKSLPAFSENDVPAELGGSPEAAEAAFQLNAEHFYSESATATPTGAVVLLWKGTEAPRQPLLTEVRSKVEADYLNAQRHDEFVAAGARLRTAIQADLKKGMNFGAAAIAAGNDEKLKVTVKNIPAFQAVNGIPDLSPALRPAFDTLSQGQISELQFDGTNGVLVYADSKKLPDPAKAAGQFAMMRARESMTFSAATANEYLGEMVDLKIKGTPLATE